jgi:hypothetical protein
LLPKSSPHRFAREPLRLSLLPPVEEFEQAVDKRWRLDSFRQITR